MSEPTPEERAATIHPHHYHVEGDGWYCCGACMGYDDEPCCLDEQRRGQCDCGLDKRREDTAAEIRAAVEAERERWLKHFPKSITMPEQVTDHITRFGDLCGAKMAEMERERCVRKMREAVMKPNSEKRGTWWTNMRPLRARRDAANEIEAAMREGT